MSCGYGPFRRLSGGSQDLPQTSSAARFLTLFREGADLSQRLQWLQSLYFQAQEELQQGVKISQKRLDTIKNTIEHELFPETVRLRIDAKGVFIEFKKNNRVPALYLSDGYRSMLALTLDLLHWAIEAYPVGSEGILKIKGVVLIDEIDAHLHPSWQRRVGFWLQEKFPNLQFIVTTHSPFIPPAAEPGAIFVLRKTAPGSDRVKVTQDLPSVQGWRFEQILVSPLFDLDSTRDPESEEKMQAHARLTAKIKAGQSLTPEEEIQLAETAKWLEQNLSPPGNSPDETERYRHIQQQVTDLLKTLNKSQA